MSYFEEGDTVPPPFNLIPTTKIVNKYLGCRKSNKGSGSVMVSIDQKLLDALSFNYLGIKGRGNVYTYEVHPY
jgi:hypothetical protein